MQTDLFSFAILQNAFVASHFLLIGFILEGNDFEKQSYI